MKAIKVLTAKLKGWCSDISDTESEPQEKHLVVCELSQAGIENAVHLLEWSQETEGLQPLYDALIVLHEKHGGVI